MLPRPEPSAGLAAYDKELAARLALDERTNENYTRYLKRGRTASPDYLPVKLDIENVSRCNFACTMCAVSKWKKGTRAADMPLDCFKRLIDEQSGLVEIKLNGLGEPLLQGEVFFQMIRYARAKRIWVRMTTNASLLHLRDNYRKLIDSGVNEIDISIDGADKQTFEGIRIQSDFDQVRANCTQLNAYCASLGIVRTKMWTLVQKANYRHLGAHIGIAREMGFKNVVFSLQLHGWGDEALAQRNSGEMVVMDENYLQTLVEAGRNSGVRVAFWNVADKFDADNLCPWPFERAVVTSDSRTVPCCMIGDPDKFELGRGLTFMQAWKSEEYRDFRGAHLSGNVPSVCRACYRETVNHSAGEYVRDGVHTNSIESVWAVLNPAERGQREAPHLPAPQQPDSRHGQAPHHLQGTDRMKRKIKYRPEPECDNCRGTHYGSSFCPFAVPYDADDSIGEKRGLSHTCNTVKKGPYKVVETS